ncbi:MAG: glycosyltransferase [Alloprevotella sp.]|nr:glycosyltransferase [Alloprevotella sp.]
MARLPLKISVITVTRNAAPLLERTMHSVESQDYPFVEHLIIDGNSDDHTLTLVHHYMERNSQREIAHEINCLSEADEGIYDAMNKGLALLTGRYVVFLNSGDTFASEHTLSLVAELAESGSRQAGVVYGDTNIVDDAGHFVRRRRLSPPDALKWEDFRFGMLVCHQAFFARVDLARETRYNLKYRYSADFDWCIRIMQLAHKRDAPLVNAFQPLDNYLQGGTSKRFRRRSLIERFRIMVSYFGWTTTLGEHLWFVLRAILRR